MRLGRLSRRHPAPQQAESRRENNKANRIPPLERRTVPDNMRLLQPPQLLQVFFHLGLVALAGMSHPFPSRTRPLSSPVAMILRSRAWESSALPVLFLSPGPVGILHRRAPGFFLPHGNAVRLLRPSRFLFFSREGAKARRRQRKMAACLAAARQFTPPIKRREGWRGSRAFSASRHCREATEGIFSSREGAKARRRQRQRKMAACLAAVRQFTPPIKRREG